VGQFYRKERQALRPLNLNFSNQQTFRNAHPAPAGCAFVLALTCFLFPTGFRQPAADETSSADLPAGWNVDLQVRVSFLLPDQLHPRFAGCPPVEGHRLAATSGFGGGCNQTIEKICIVGTIKLHGFAYGFNVINDKLFAGKHGIEYLGDSILFHFKHVVQYPVQILHRPTMRR